MGRNTPKGLRAIQLRNEERHKQALASGADRNERGVHASELVNYRAVQEIQIAWRRVFGVHHREKGPAHLAQFDMLKYGPVNALEALHKDEANRYLQRLEPMPTCGPENRIGSEEREKTSRALWGT